MAIVFCLKMTNLTAKLYLQNSLSSRSHYVYQKLKFVKNSIFVVILSIILSFLVISPQNCHVTCHNFLTMMSNKSLKIVMGMFQNCCNHVGRNLIQTMAAIFVIDALPNC